MAHRRLTGCDPRLGVGAKAEGYITTALSGFAHYEIVVQEGEIRETILEAKKAFHVSTMGPGPTGAPG